MSEELKAFIAYQLIAFILNLVLGYRSQVNAWAESKPRLASALKLLRATGIDPWMLLQSLSLAVRKRLPAAVRVDGGAVKLEGTAPENENDTEQTRVQRIPPVLCLLALLALLPGCAAFQSAKPVLRTVDDVATNLCALFFADRESISVEDAARTFCRTKRQLQPWIDEVLAAQQAAGLQAVSSE
jgi:hypothetical protein